MLHSQLVSLVSRPAAALVIAHIMYCAHLVRLCSLLKSISAFNVFVDLVDRGWLIAVSTHCWAAVVGSHNADSAEQWQKKISIGYYWLWLREHHIASNGILFVQPSDQQHL